MTAYSSPAQAVPMPPRPNRGLMGAAVFIVSESMFFLGLFLAYFYLRTDYTLLSDQPRPNIVLPIVNTIILAVSVAAIVWAEWASARGNQRSLVIGLSLSAVLGLVFMVVQSAEFMRFAQLGFTPGSSSFGSTFFALLLFHVARVFGGLVFMVIVLIRAVLGQFTPRRRTAVQACALYWYFIACVWLVVFAVLYSG